MANTKSKRFRPPMKKILSKVTIQPPKVSVILSSYNHASYIVAAIESVLNQTFTDFELLIYDDGSTDNSREIIKSFEDPRIKTFLYEENRGSRIAAQECFAAAKGTYIAIHHSDDIWATDKLAKQVEFLDAHEEYAACFTWVEFIDENSQHYELSERDIYYKVFDQKNRSREQWLHDLFFYGNCFCHPSVLIRNTKIVQEIYNVNGLWQLTDYSSWIRLLLRADIYVIEERLTQFRLRRNKQENTSAERPDTAFRSELELYHVLQEYRNITDHKKFLKIFPEAQAYVVNGNILLPYALAKILQLSNGAARKLLALDILFDLINDKSLSKKLAQWYNYGEKDFTRDNAQSGILYPSINVRFLHTSLYYDTGAGFSERNRIRTLTYVRQDGDFLSEFFLNEENIYRFRFDPSENEALAIKIDSATINGEKIEIQSVPPFKEVDGYQIFFTYDPQYIFNYSGAGNVRVEIRGKISHEYDALYILRGENLELQAIGSNLKMNLAKVTAQVNSNVKQIKGLQEQLRADNKKIDDLQAQITADNKTIDDLQELQNSHLQQISNLQGQVNTNLKKIDNLNNQVNANNQQIGDLNGQVNSLNAHLNEIHSSRGYRLLQKYYALRDKILPKGSTRRLLVKNLAWAMFNPSRAISLVNRDNIGKVLSTLRHGGFRQLMIRSDNKLNSPAVANIEKADEIKYGNVWLDNKDIYAVPNDVVVDILVPIYNAVDFTRKCLETVYKNTDVPFNLYLIDDCSPDERIQILLDEVKRWEKSPFMRHLEILKNDDNLGFIGSVNRGFKMTKNNVVLLNTDTEVPPNWLSRLLRPMLEDKLIASVTPFSNSAEICSFPTICANNDLPVDMTVTELDKIFSRYGDLEPCDMPTGIGFCMLMRRECIEKYGVFDTAFGKGYGEENDWCRRTAAQGYRHVHVKNLFVYHKHGASFAERQDKSKKQRLAENLARLNERYPGYDKLVQEYIQDDPAGANRIFLNYCVQAKFSDKGVMFLNHSMGGGATVYQNRIITQLKENWRVYSMEPLADGRTLLIKNYNDNEDEKVADFNLESMNAEEFSELLKALNINWLYINQLVTYPIPKILNWIIQSKVPYTFFGHDFFAICPRYQLLNEDMNYCGAEIDFKKCAACLEKSSMARVNSVDISNWRSNFKNFLENAKEVIVPSSNTAEIFQLYYSSPITVREHEVDTSHLTYTFRKEFAYTDILTVAVIGSIGIEKGSKIIYALADELEKNSMPLKLIVIGITNLHNNSYSSDSGKFEITGPYRNEEISELLARHEVGVVIIPSIWPETYSYTTTEAMYSGYPVIVFPIGAPADRVQRTNGGWILENISLNAVMDKLNELLKDRGEIVSKAKNLAQFES